MNSVLPNITSGLLNKAPMCQTSWASADKLNVKFSKKSRLRLRLGAGPPQQVSRRLMATTTYFGNHYEVLGIPRDATQKDIKDAYLKRSKECHPDILAKDKSANSEAEVNAKFAAVNEAYSVLGKVKSKREYDLGLPSQPGMGPASWHARHPQEGFSVHTNFSGYKTMTFEERKAAYGFKETDYDYFKKMNNRQYYVAAGCVAFIVFGAAVHYVIIKLMYKKHERQLDLLNAKGQMWLKEAKDRRSQFSSNKEFMEEFARIHAAEAAEREIKKS